METTVIEPTNNQQDANPLPIPVDLIRAVAITLVIMLHASIESYGGIQLSESASQLYWWTQTTFNSITLPCVPLFVMLSGALLLQPSKTNEPIMVFLKKRLSRIGLAFVFWSAIYFAWSALADGTALTLTSVMQGLLLGPYYHFWFIYLIAGLYLITPILRGLIASGNPKILTYLIGLWFVGVAAVPFFQTTTGLSLNNNVFVIGGWIGYFVLGAYLMKAQVRTRTLLMLLAAGFAVTIAGAWLMNFPFHAAEQYYFFFNSLTANVIVASVALFLILRKVPTDWPAKNHLYAGKLVHAISKYTLPIFLLHIIILESLQRGYFGFKLSLTTINPIVEVPLITAATLFISLGLVLALKKVPLLKTLIG